MKSISILLFSFVFSLSLMAGANPTGTSAPAGTAALNGYVLDRLSGEALGGVEITIEGTDQHFYTDFDGKFEIQGLAPGSYNLIVSYISYEKSLLESIPVKAGDENSLDIRLVATK
ncbi:MAG TPA: carboxypeptidase-like regulatory domain-containing protein [Bacteroidales bacterium]|nr:carboxypeptidase-like regulatory domain-containing protein [Bacteroidales bacterium]HRZ76148.1 carboxypeptidase-like regulatory domain-containing protein [Bacteroidales bacterium]